MTSGKRSHRLLSGKVNVCTFPKPIPLTIGEKTVEGLGITKIRKKLCFKWSKVS